MKFSSNHRSIAVRVLLVSAGVLFAGCREKESASSPEPAAANEVASAEIQASTEEEIAEVQREIDEGKQEIGNLDAFVLMERSKLDENPEYDRTFLLEALDEQELLKEKIETGEARLKELTGSQE